MASPPRANILLVDDNAANLLALESVLKALDQNLVMAASGEEALKHLLDEDFAVILLDVQMPGLNGFDTAALIRKRDRSRHVPIIFVTAIGTGPEDIFKGYSLGAVDYLLKPFTPEVLRSKVSVFVELYRKSAEARARSEQAQAQGERVRQIERREHARRLEEVQAQRNRFFSLSLDMMCIATFDGYFKELNPAWEKTLGFTAAELCAEPFIQFVHPADRDGTLQQWRSLRHGPSTVSFESRFRTRAGDYRWLAWSATAFPAERLYYAVARDVTERKRIESLKDDFIATASHELRTPLTSIHAALRLVTGDAGVPEHARRMIDIAFRNSSRLAHLIQQILDIEKLESGRLDFLFQPADLGALVRQAIDEHRPSADQQEVPLVFEMELPDTRFYIDSDRMLQVMTNLLSNAVRFSPPRQTVVVSLRARPGGVRIAVTDRGPGIPEEFRGRLFEKFAQAGAGDSRRRGGAGLGLSIAKGIVERHGGRIGFEHSLDGTTFHVDLPAWLAERAPAEGPLITTF